MVSAFPVNVSLFVMRPDDQHPSYFAEFSFLRFLTHFGINLKNPNLNLEFRNSSVYKEISSGS